MQNLLFLMETFSPPPYNRAKYLNIRYYTNLLAFHIPMYNIGTCPPSASSQQNASQGRAGTLWAFQRCSVVSRPCRVGTGRIIRGEMSKGLGTGTLVAWPAAERPTKKKQWRAARERKPFQRSLNSSDNFLMKHVTWKIPPWHKVQLLLNFEALAKPKLPSRRKSWKKGQLL